MSGASAVCRSKRQLERVAARSWQLMPSQLTRFAVQVFHVVFHYFAVFFVLFSMLSLLQRWRREAPQYKSARRAKSQLERAGTRLRRRWTNWLTALRKHASGEWTRLHLTGTQDPSRRRKLTDVTYIQRMLEMKTMGDAQFYKAMVGPFSCLGQNYDLML